jgi:alkylation response protein AidB-like acyl-CoA dehydrogenase
VDDGVYDMTSFLDSHPGGKKIVLKVAGQDASKQFWKYHNKAILNKYKPKLQVGTIGGAGAEAAPKSEAKKVLASATPSNVNAVAVPAKSAATPVQDAPAEKDFFGDMVPYADPSWYQGWASPYYKESHKRLREEVREWVETEIMPNCHEWDEAKSMPESIYRQMGERGYLCGAIGIKFPKEYTDIRVKSVSPEEWDHFHELILTDELARCGSGGVVWNLLGGYGIGLPPLFKFGKQELKDRVLPDIIAGKKRICLAITEPDAGSDVANLTCTAKLTPDGKHYIVNGEKKWITNGLLADYFTTAVRTGGPGMNGVSLLCIEKTMPGITTRQMKCMGVWSSATTYITFEDVKVPVENLIGKENQGFKVIMTNFNHERIGIIIQSNRFARVCYEEAFKYSLKRKTFGQRLFDHGVINMKLAQMGRQLEAAHAKLEEVIYQTQTMGETEAMLMLGGAVAGLKAQYVCLSSLWLLTKGRLSCLSTALAKLLRSSVVYRTRVVDRVKKWSVCTEMCARMRKYSSIHDDDR